jgi:signal transduction histidine kinase
MLDQGPGIPMDEIGRVWDRFYHVLGSGLDLSIVKRIADLHGARVSLSPGANGKGLRANVIFQGG